MVHGLDAWYDMKSRGYTRPLGGYRPIHMPRNTASGVILSALAFIFGFAMIWYIWWLAALSLIGLFVVGIGHTFNYNRDYFVPSEEVERIEAARSDRLGKATGA